MEKVIIPYNDGFEIYYQYSVKRDSSYWGEWLLEWDREGRGHQNVRSKLIIAWKEKSTWCQNLQGVLAANFRVFSNKRECPFP